jgi:pSer/pThr/pTyr-binding forkhead associated (FHA) protein
MDAKLVVVGGNARPAEIKLKLPVTIGRGRKATLVVPHPLVSRVHCEVYESEGYLVVRDLDSLNGTFINNRRVTEAVLAPGELLTLGGITFRAVYDIGRAARPLPVESSTTPSTTLPPQGSSATSATGEQQSDDNPPSNMPRGDGEARTEVADVDPDEFADQLRETEKEREGD